MNCKHCKADCCRRGEDREKECRGYIPVTNADRIRAMSDEELAKWVTEFVELVLEDNGLDDKYKLDPNFETSLLDKLKQPCKEDT